jgi:hypothetical protein
MKSVVCFLATGTLLCALAGCDYASKWKNQQVATSHAIAQGDKVTPPATPPARAEDLGDDLPVYSLWKVIEYTEGDGTVMVKLLSNTGAGSTTIWLSDRLSQMGYENADNQSRLLDGVTCIGRGKYKNIWVKVDMNTSDQVTVELQGSN